MSVLKEKTKYIIYKKLSINLFYIITLYHIIKYVNVYIIRIIILSTKNKVIGEKLIKNIINISNGYFKKRRNYI